MRITLWISAWLLAISFGFGEGLWTGRWAHSDVLDVAAKQLGKLPKTIGEWESTDRELSREEVVMAELSGHVMRTYTRKETNQVVSVLLVCGKPGPISVHTPDICFKGIGFQMTTEPVVLPYEELTARFWTTRFEKGNSPVEQYTVLWGWTTDGTWVAANNPRIEFATQNVLHKLYVIRPLGTKDTAPKDDAPLNEFLSVFMPSVNLALFTQ